MKYYRSTLTIICNHHYFTGVTVIEYLRNLVSLILKYCQQGQQQQPFIFCTDLFPLVEKEGTPTDNELEELGGEIAKDWIKLGRRLEVSDPNIEEIDEAHDRLSEKGYHMLKHWKQDKGSAATYQALCEALQHKLVQRKDLAEKFCYRNGN